MFIIISKKNTSIQTSTKVIQPLTIKDLTWSHTTLWSTGKRWRCQGLNCGVDFSRWFPPLNKRLRFERVFQGASIAGERLLQVYFILLQDMRWNILFRKKSPSFSASLKLNECRNETSTGKNTVTELSQWSKIETSGGISEFYQFPVWQADHLHPLLLLTYAPCAKWLWGSANTIDSHVHSEFGLPHNIVPSCLPIWNLIKCDSLGRPNCPRKHHCWPNN